MSRVAIPESDFAGKFATLRASRDPVYVLFTSTRSPPETGERWCPDCASSDAVVDEAFAMSAPASATLLEVRIERGRWKVDPGPAHPFRAAPFFVKSIPTLVKWDGAAARVARRVVDCEQLELLTDLFADAPAEPGSGEPWS